MRRILLALLVVFLSKASFAQPSVALYCQSGTTSSGQIIWSPASTAHPCPMTGTGGVFNNASVGTNGATAPTSSTQAGGVDGSGNLQPFLTTTYTSDSQAAPPSGLQDVGAMLKVLGNGGNVTRLYSGMEAGIAGASGNNSLSTIQSLFNGTTYDQQKGDATNGAWVNVRGANPYPATATPLVKGSGNVANATASASLTPSSTTTAYITGFEVTGSGATVGLPVTCTITGVLGGTLSYTYTATVGALLPDTPLIVEYPVAIPASAVNTPLVVSCPALGSGSTNNTVVAHGYQL